MPLCYNLRTRRKEELHDAHVVELHTDRGVRHQLKGTFADGTKGCQFVSSAGHSHEHASHKASHAKGHKGGLIFPDLNGSGHHQHGGDLLSDIFGGVKQGLQLAPDVIKLLGAFKGAGVKKHRKAHHSMEHLLHEEDGGSFMPAGYGLSEAYGLSSGYGKRHRKKKGKGGLGDILGLLGL
jgi:hypothetical protein